MNLKRMCFCWAWLFFNLLSPVSLLCVLFSQFCWNSEVCQCNLEITCNYFSSALKVNCQLWDDECSPLVDYLFHGVLEFGSQYPAVKIDMMVKVFYWMMVRIFHGVLGFSSLGPHFAASGYQRIHDSCLGKTRWSLC